MNRTNFKDPMTLENYRILRCALLDLIAQHHPSCSEVGQRKRQSYRQALAELRALR